jgi:hypothetical protein
MEEVAHHEHGQHQAGDQQRDTEDEADRGSLTKSQTNDEAGDEQDQADTDAE